jgi:hypothetical protein
VISGRKNKFPAGNKISGLFSGLFSGRKNKFPAENLFLDFSGRKIPAGNYKVFWETRIYKNIPDFFILREGV